MYVHCPKRTNSSAMCSKPKTDKTKAQFLIPKARTQLLSKY